MSAPFQSELQAETEARLRFEMLLADVCAQFVNVAVGDIDSKIANAQRVICESLRVDHSSVWQVSQEKPDLLDMIHVYRDPNLKPLPIQPNVQDYFPWSSSKILNKEIVCVPNTATLPPEAEKDKESWEQYGIHSSLVIPLSVGGGSVIGILAFDSEREHDWSEPLQRRLQILAFVFAQALARKHAEQKVRESEERLRLAVQAGKMFAYSWDAATDVIQRSGESDCILGVKSDQAATGAAISAMVHPDDKQRLEAALSNLKVENPTLQITYRIIRPDGAVAWLERNSRAYFDEQGKLKRVVGMIADVTERKRAEEIRFRHAAVIESSDDAIATGTLDGNIVSWNAGAQKIYGYTEAEAIGKPINMLVPPELPDEENKILETLRSGGSIEHFETLRVTKTGKRINVSLTISPIKDSTGKIVGISGIARDITERKHTEEALRASEGRLRLAQQAARIGTFERDVPTGRIAWAEGLDSLYGLPPGSVHGQTPAFFNDLIHPADRERVAHLIQEALKTGQPSGGEWRAIWPDGSVHWIAGRWQVLMDDCGEPSRVVGVNMDVTERKLAELTLHAQEELLKIFVKNVPAPVAMLDRDMHYLQVSDRWCTDYLSGRAQILGRSHYELFPDMPERWKEVHRRALAGETLRADEDHWEGQGGPHWARWEVRPWTTPEGTVGGILILAEDITRRKQMEEALSGMTRKLIESQEQERSRIGRELHDDINQRLAMLAVELGQLQENPSEAQSRVPKLRKQVTEISNDVQALSHDLHSSKLEYLGVVAGIKSWCKEFAERQKMEIDFKSDVSTVVPFDVGICLFRVLQEALHNASKHSGVKRIEVQLSERLNEVHLLIGDLGRGFDVEPALQGQGLGLTSMQERVRLLNGSIEIQSKPMGGTTIHVRVPLEAEHGSQRAAG